MARPRKEFTLNDKQRTLIEDNMLLFYKCIHKLKNKYHTISYDEIWDCCTEAAVKVAYDFDEKKGKYSTLLFVAAERNVLKRIRYYDFDCRKGSKGNLSLDYEYSENEESGENFAERYLGIEDDHEFIENDVAKRMFSVLGKREKEVMHKIIIEDIARSDIAKEWGVKLKTVNTYVDSARKKIRKAYKL